VSTPAHHHLFYAPRGLIRDGRIYFSKDESAHIVSSLRKAAGEVIAVTDGAGRRYGAELEEAGRGGVVARVTGVELVGPPDVSLTLFQGMIRPQRMDLVVEKCVELGADAIVPLLSERALERDTGQRLSRWNKIAVEAMKQSLRVYLPEVRPAVHFADALGRLPGFDISLLAHGRETGDGFGADPGIGKGSIGFFVGPEGGFSDAEIEALTERGARILCLGGARLKSETAAIAGVALIRRFL
jgi:16S rRNA (uracil1498-N3)-methyltransferase